MELGLVFGSVVFLIAGIALAGNSLEVKAQSDLEIPSIAANATANAVEQGLKKYENATLGITFQYPLNWTLEDTSGCSVYACLNFYTMIPKLDPATNTSLNANECVGEDFILMSVLNKCDVYSISLRVYELDKLHKGGFLEKPCVCNTLKDFVAWSYERSYAPDLEYFEEDLSNLQLDLGDLKLSNHTFINDNQTIIGNNHSAWQMEIVTSSGYTDSKDKDFTVWAINDKFGYEFVYIECLQTFALTDILTILKIC